MENDNKNIDSETESTPTKLEPEPEIFSSMNEVSEGDSKLFRNGILIILTMFVAFLGKACYQYMKHH
jgi:hypothetical protein